MNQKDWPNADKEQTCYRTGFTQPKKPRRGIVAAVLILIIFFCGMNTVFRLLDIRLFREITKDAGIAPASVRFSPGEETDGANTPGIPALGITGESVTAFDRLYYDVPTGFYITHIVPGGPASDAGILPGDVLLYFNGRRTPDADTLLQEIATCDPGSDVRLLLSRKKSPYSVNLCLDNLP